MTEGFLNHKGHSGCVVDGALGYIITGLEYGYTTTPFKGDVIKMKLLDEKMRDLTVKYWTKVIKEVEDVKRIRVSTTLLIVHLQCPGVTKG